MRIVAVADTHLGHGALVIPEGDVFLHAGDLCRSGSLKELRTAADWIRSLPHKTKIVVAGNHDWAFVNQSSLARDLLGPGVIYLQDAETRVGGVRFWGSPWQPEFFDWAFNLPRGPALKAKWAMIPRGIEVLVTHGPPEGIGDLSMIGNRRTGCRDLLLRVRELAPKLHLFGHIHEDGGVWNVDGVTYVNCTTWDGRRAPSVIDFEPGVGVKNVLAPPAGA